MSVHFSTGKDDWGTPDDLFWRLSVEFRFTLDAAASKYNAKCDDFFTEEEDALKQDWRAASRRKDGSRGAVWLNPPYSAGRQAPFLRKARDESAKFNGPVVVCLIPARPDTRVWHEVVFPCAKVLFLRGRVRFVGAPTGAPFPSAVVIFGLSSAPTVGAWDWRKALTPPSDPAA